LWQEARHLPVQSIHPENASGGTGARGGTHQLHCHPTSVLCPWRLFLIQEPTISWRFGLFWALAFLGFPVGGLLANVIVGPITTPIRAALAGAITGAVLGLVQWLVLKSRLPLPITWLIATSVGMAIGLALSTVFLGSTTTGNELLWRAAITGFSIGLAQWLVLQRVLPQSAIWIAVVGLGWVVGWFITRSAGIDLDLKWPVFGSTGAWAFQLLTGLALYLLLRSSQGEQ
jgi:hypothetical protein